MQLPERRAQPRLTLYEQYDAVEEMRKQAEKELVTESHRHPISRVLESGPGLGPIRVAQLIPIVVSPVRFRTKRQFWSYCGLGIVMRSSSDWVRTKDGGWYARRRAADAGPEPEPQPRAEARLQGRGDDRDHAAPDRAPAPGLRAADSPRARSRPSRS